MVGLLVATAQYPGVGPQLRSAFSIHERAVTCTDVAPYDAQKRAPSPDIEIVSDTHATVVKESVSPVAFSSKYRT